MFLLQYLITQLVFDKPVLVRAGVIGWVWG